VTVIVISFIVPAYNEEFYLAGTLNALHAAGRASNQAYEIIVAESGVKFHYVP
jgi:glycosyltransferase involved in cell wall biosynthesis